MYDPQVADNIHFIGAFDPFIRTFDIIMKTANGSSYNAYVVRGSEGVAVMDTVKVQFKEEFFANLEKQCEYSEIKYIVLHHLEPDHSGAIPELLEKAPNATLIVSARGATMIEDIFHQPIKVETAYTSKSISLGDKTIHFLSTPFLHWPETMSSYVEEDKLLFSGDVFGSHYYDNRLYNDKVGDFDYAFRYYYDHIMRPFKSYVLNALKLYDKYEIDTIAPLHGPVLRNNPKKYMDLYREWSSETRFSKYEFGEKMVSIFYISSYENTHAMAQAIFEGIDSVDGIRASIYDLSALDMENMIDLLEESDGILIGTPTINGDAVKPAWDLLSYMAYVESRGKFGASFGSYGWSGEAAEMLHVRMQGLKFRLPLQPLRLKLIPDVQGLKECFDYGVEYAEFLGGKMMEMEL